MERRCRNSFIIIMKYLFQNRSTLLSNPGIDFLFCNVFEVCSLFKVFEFENVFIFFTLSV